MRLIEKLSVVFMVIMLIMSFMPIGFAETDDAAATGIVAKSTNTGPVRTVGGSVGADSRIAKCVSFVSGNNLDERPADTCARLLNKELDCVGFLKSKNVAEPVAKCDAFFRTTAVVAKKVAVAQNTGVAVADTRMRIAERLSRERPVAKAFVEKLTDDKVKVFSALPRAEQNKIMEMDESERMKKLDNYRVKTVNKDMLFKKREIAKDKLDDAKRKYEMAKNEYQRVNKAYNEKKREFNEVKDRLKDCKDQDTEECNELRELAKEHAKEYIINGAQMAIEHLNKIKNKVEAADGMDDERANEIIADIDETNAKLLAAIEKVKAAETKEEVQEGAKEVAKAWKHIKNAEKVHAARVVHSTMWNIIKKSEQLEKRMENARDRIADNGIDVAGLDEKITLFSEKINDAKNKFNESEELLREAAELRKENATNEDIREKVSEANAKLREAHNDIKEAYKIFASIIRDVSARGGKITAVDDETVVIEEVNDDDADEVEEEEEADDETDAEEIPVDSSIQLSGIDNAECWADKPAYTPGVDKGYFIWQGKCADFWWVDWSGDTKDDLRKLLKCVRERRITTITSDDAAAEDVDAIDDLVATAEEIVDEAESETVDADTFCSELTLEEFKELRKNLLYTVSGTIKSNGVIFDAGVRRFDGNDKLKFKDNEIEFKARVGSHFDGLFFRTTGDKVEFELSFDGETSPDFVYVGKDKANPDTNPFTLEGTPAKKARACRSGYVVYNKKCVNRVLNRVVKADGIE
ncbi:MAG: hypothetical protein ABIG84_06935 [archaeon]